MVKNKDENKECKEKTNEHKGGFREPKNVLTGKSKNHQAVALKNKFEKKQISEEVAIAPGDNKLEEPVPQEAIVTDLEKEAELIVPDKDEGSVILRYKDSEKDNILEKVFAYEKMSGTTIPLDFESDNGSEKTGSFIMDIKKSEVDEFRKFMKDFEEIPDVSKAVDSGKIEQEIAEVQSKRSNRAIAIDKSITASRVGRKDNPIDLKDWSENPNTLDLLGVDDGEV